MPSHARPFVAQGPTRAQIQPVESFTIPLARIRDQFLNRRVKSLLFRAGKFVIEILATSSKCFAFVNSSLREQRTPNFLTRVCTLGFKTVRLVEVAYIQ